MCFRTTIIICSVCFIHLTFTYNIYFQLPVPAEYNLMKSERVCCTIVQIAKDCALNRGNILKVHHKNCTFENANLADIRADF